MFKETRNGEVVLLEVQNVINLNDIEIEIEIEKAELAILTGSSLSLSAIALKIQDRFDAIAVYNTELDSLFSGNGNCMVVFTKTPKYKLGQIVPLCSAFVGRPSKWPPGLEMTSIRVPIIIKKEALKWASRTMWERYGQGLI